MNAIDVTGYHWFGKPDDLCPDDHLVLLRTMYDNGQQLIGIFLSKKKFEKGNTKEVPVRAPFYIDREFKCIRALACVYHEEVEFSRCILDDYLRFFYYEGLKGFTGHLLHTHEQKNYIAAYDDYWRKITENGFQCTINEHLISTSYETKQSGLELKIDNGLRLRISRMRYFNFSEKAVCNHFKLTYDKPLDKRKKHGENNREYEVQYYPSLIIYTIHKNGMEGSHILMYKDPIHKKLIDSVFGIYDESHEDQTNAG